MAVGMYLERRRVRQVEKDIVRGIKRKKDIDQMTVKRCGTAEEIKERRAKIFQAVNELMERGYTVNGACTKLAKKGEFRNAQGKPMTISAIRKQYRESH